MRTRDKRVVVTGLGAVTPVGLTVDDFWKALLAGQSGISEISAFDTTGFAVRIAGELKDFDPEVYLSRREVRTMDRFPQLFYAATAQALSDAGIDYSDDPDAGLRTGAVVGGGIGGIISVQESIEILFVARWRPHESLHDHADHPQYGGRVRFYRLQSPRSGQLHGYGVRGLGERHW